MNKLRTWMVGSIVTALALVGCSGSGSGDGGGSSLTCDVAGAMSQPNSADDPCDQTDASCASMGGVAVNCCMDTGKWMATCTCMLPSSNLSCSGATGIVNNSASGATAGTGAAGTNGSTVTGQGQATCGNGVVETGEQCDGSSMGGETCTSMGLGSGVLMCSSACTYDTQMCMMATDMGVGGSGSGVGGSGSP